MPSLLPGAGIDVDAAVVENSCSPFLYGACIEDVNHEIYGGLYGQLLHGESFEEPGPVQSIAGWTVDGGRWSPFGNGVSVAASRGGRLVREQAPFPDGSFEFELRFTSPPEGDTNAGAVVRVRNSGVGADAFDGYEISLAADGRKIILARHQQNFVPLRSAPVSVGPFGFFEWQRLRVLLHGGRIQIYLNGGTSPVIDYTDPAPLPLGSVGLRTWGANAEFRNINCVADGRAESSQFVGAPPVQVSGMWDRVQTGSARANFSLDATGPFNGARSQRVEHTGGTGSVGVANRGLNRWGITVRKGHAYAGRVHLRSGQLQGAVTVSLQSADGARTYARETLSGVSATWTKFSFTLNATDDDPNARFAVTIDAPGVLWIDQAILRDPPTGQFHGLPVREDIADALVAGKLSFLRYGGTAVNAPEYRWKKMIGDPDRRPPYQGNWHPYTSNGFGIAEYVAFCERAGIEAAFAVNVEEAPQDLADMIEYLNGPVTTRWGKTRADDGHPLPYGVKRIEIGNEEVIWGDISADYDYYVERFRLLAAAMRKVDPRLEFINAAWWRGDNPNCQRVFKALEGDAAYWDFHTDADAADSGVQVGRTLAEAERLFQRWVPGAKMKAVIFEENGGRHDLQRALGHATTLNAVHRHGDFVAADCEANGLQPWRQNDNGWDQGHVFFTPDQVWGMPPYYAQQMAAANHLPLVVSSQVTGSPDLDVTATKSTDGRTVCLHVVNLGPAETVTQLKIKGLLNVDHVARVWTLSGDLKDENTPARPTAIQPVAKEIDDAADHFDYTFPARSYTILRLTANTPAAGDTTKRTP